MRNMTSASRTAIELELAFGARNYHPLPVVLTKGEGVFVWDVEGKRYYDFLSAYSAVNQGHCHPRIINALIEQALQLTLTSRAFHNDLLGEYAKMMSETFGYSRLLPMNTGAEAVETAIKLCRRWAYDVKKIPDGQAEIIVCENNFHGRTTGIISFSSDPDARRGFGPYMPGFTVIPFNDVAALKKALENKNAAGFLVEPVQAEAGVFTADDGYLAACSKLCREANVLFLADEIQTGLGRTGRMLACDSEGVRPDILLLGKSLGGGMLPVSAVLADDEIMLTIKPGEHGSTFGGSPLACRVAMTALQVIMDEKLAENAYAMGKIFRHGLKAINSPLISDIRGKGLLTGITVRGENKAWTLCTALMGNGLLAKPAHGDKIRFAPPLVISEDQIHECLDIIKVTLAGAE